MKLFRKATDDEKATYPFIFLACLLLFYMLGLPLVVLKADFWLGMALIVPPAFGMGALILILGREIHREKRWKEMWLVMWWQPTRGEWSIAVVRAPDSVTAMLRGMKLIRPNVGFHEDAEGCRAIQFSSMPLNYVYTQEE